MDEAKVLVSHHISLHNSAIALEQCPVLEDCDPTNLTVYLVQSPELIISCAISDVSNKELLSVPPALALVVAQLNLYSTNLSCF